MAPSINRNPTAMKANYFFRFPIVRACAIALGLVTLPATSQADHHHHHGYYYSYPHTGFALSFGTGWLGQGYYYGPPGVPYYYERPGVTYYRNYYNAPRAYYGGAYYGHSRDVRRALHGLG